MLNETFRMADHVSLPVPADTPSGKAVRIGALNAITATAEGGGGNLAGYATCWLRGGYEYAITSPGAVGSAVYLAADGTLTGTVTGAVFGHIIRAAQGSDLPVVRLAN